MILLLVHQVEEHEPKLIQQLQHTRAVADGGFCIQPSIAFRRHVQEMLNVDLRLDAPVKRVQ